MMIELGYLAKRISSRPEWLDVTEVRGIYSVCNCISVDFCDYIQAWKHNGFWLFDHPSVIQAVAAIENVDLQDTALIYLQGYEQQYDADSGLWSDYGPETGVPVAVKPPSRSTLLGFDVVTYSMQNAPEHSPLSCNHVASEVQVNTHCLVDSVDLAIECLERGIFNNAEPGPLRILAVKRVDWNDVH